MRRWFVCIAVLIATLAQSVPAHGDEGCRVIFIHRPDGQPPIEIEICP